jgi:hypothetical protein
MSKGRSASCVPKVDEHPAREAFPSSPGRWFWVAHASRVWAKASRFRELFASHFCPAAALNAAGLTREGGSAAPPGDAKKQSATALIMSPEVFGAVA